MTRMGKCFKENTIVLIRYPFTDLSKSKSRPALILRNQQDEDLVCLPISSQIGTTRNDVKIEDTDCLNFTFPISSFIRIQKVFTLHSSLVKREIGSFTPQFFKKVKKEFTKFLNS